MKNIIAWFSILLIWSGSAYSQGTDTISHLKVSEILYHKKGSGKPAIIFVSGLGEDHNTWQNLQDSISQFALTISYDRAGLGGSEYKGEKKDLRSLAIELHQLIRTAAVPNAIGLFLPTTNTAKY
jgi:pimeloyl-ACP methyl ester carboxylesterase